MFCELTFNFFYSPIDVFGFLQRVWIVTKLSWMCSETNVSEKLNIFRLVQLPFVSVGFAWRYAGLIVLCPLISGTWASADLDICVKRRGPAASPPYAGDTGDDCDECPGFFLPLSHLPIFLNLLSFSLPHSVFQGPLNLFWALLQ